MNAVVFLETVRRHLTNIPFLVGLLAASFVAAMIATMGGPPVIFEAVALLAYLLACQLIGPEFSRGTLQLILVKPLNRSAYLLSRVAGVVVVLWIAIWAPFAFDILARLIARQDIGWSSAVMLPANVSISMILITALFTLFGSMSRSYLNVAIYFGLRIGLPLFNGVISAIDGGSIVRRFPFIVKAVNAVNQNLFPEADGGGLFNRQWMLMVLSNAAIALLLACIVFRKREVPYGAD